MNLQPIRHLKPVLLSLGLAATSLFNPLATLAADVGSDLGSAIKGHSKVAIAEFGVEFYTQLNGQGRAGGATAEVTSQLIGVSDATMQAITDQAYADTIAALQSAGFEVIDQGTLLASPGYQTLAEKYGLASPYTLTDGSFGERAPAISKIFAPPGMKAFFSSAIIRGDFGQRVDAQNQKRGMDEGAVAKSLGATLLHVHYLASFGLVSGTKNGFLNSIAGHARAAIEPQAVLFPTDTEIQFVTEAGNRTFTTSKRGRHSGAVYLDQPLLGSSELFTLRDTTSTDTKRGDAATNALGMLFGTGVGQKTKTSEVVAQSEDAYRSAFQSLITEAAKALTQALK